MREVFVKGAEIKRQADTERAAIARTRQRLNEFDRQEEEKARDKNRVDQFRRRFALLADNFAAKRSKDCRLDCQISKRVVGDDDFRHASVLHKPGRR